MPEQHGWIIPGDHDAMVAGLKQQIASDRSKVDSLWSKDHPPMDVILKLIDHIRLCEDRLLLLS